MSGPGFLDLPVRSAKPRRTGITHVLDRGTPLAQATELLVQNECYVDVWKFGWGIAYLDTVPMPDAAKRDLIAAAAERFIVLAEVGSKHAAVRLSLRADTYGALAPGPVMGALPVRGT